MKRVLLAALCALAIVGCSDDKGYEYEVVANIGYPDATFYLSPLEDLTKYHLQAVSDKDGVVRFKGTATEPMIACVSDGIGRVAAPVFIEEGVVTVDRMEANPKLFLAQGTPSNDAYKSYLESLQALELRFMATAGEEATPELDSVMNIAFDSLDMAVERANFDNVFGVFLFVNGGMQRCANRTEVDSVVTLFPESLRGNSYLQSALKNVK